MALKESEAIVLRTYPLRESDLLVTLFTRLEGKVKGVARAAMKSRRRFGGALEPLTYVRASYDDRERQELARLDSCEVIESPMASEVSYQRAAALAHVAELLDELMPDREASDAVFRLSLAVLQEMRGPSLWMPLTYFELWMTRLMGFLPEFSECVVCGRALDGSRAFYHALADGLVCADDKRDGIVGAIVGIEKNCGADVALAGFGVLRNRLAESGGCRSAQISSPDSGAAHREEAGDGGDAGEDQRLASLSWHLSSDIVSLAYGCL